MTISYLFHKWGGSSANRAAPSFTPGSTIGESHNVSELGEDLTAFAERGYRIVAQLPQGDDVLLVLCADIDDAGEVRKPVFVQFGLG